MQSSSNQDLLDLHGSIRVALRGLEEVIFSSKPIKLAEQKKAFLSLKQKIRTLLRYSEFLQTYADSSYESSVSFEREATKLAREKELAQHRLQDQATEAMMLQKRVLEQEREIHELRMMNQLDAFYISSISFDASKDKNPEDTEEFSENSEIGQSGVGSYYSFSSPQETQKGSQVQNACREEEKMDWALSTDNLDLSHSLEFMTFPQIG